MFFICTVLVIYVIHKYHYTQFVSDVNRINAKVFKIYIKSGNIMYKPQQYTHIALFQNEYIHD